eukprot:scaffold273_cov349-Prasinococcus_capsulatus_cf.AAC.9
MNLTALPVARPWGGHAGTSVLTALRWPTTNHAWTRPDPSLGGRAAAGYSLITRSPAGGLLRP